MNKIKCVSLFFRVLFQAGLVGCIALQIFGWFYLPMDGFYFNIIPKGYQSYVLSPLSNSDRIAGFFITAVPTILKLMMFYFLIKLLCLYEKFEFFSENNVRYIKQAGYSLLLFQLINPVCEFILGFILTANNPPGLRFARMSLTELNVGLILTALIIILISWIMAEGVKLQNEQQLTI